MSSDSLEINFFESENPILDMVEHELALSPTSCLSELVIRWYNVAYATPFKQDNFECCPPLVPENNNELLEILASLAIGDFRGAFVTYFTNQLILLGEAQAKKWLKDFDKEVEKAVKDAF